MGVAAGLRMPDPTARAHPDDSRYGSTMAPLEISLFGGFEFRREGSRLAPIGLRAGRSLLAYLAINRDRDHTRDLLSGTFWPEMDEQRARRRLSQALWQIHSIVSEEDEAPIIITQGDRVRFDPAASYWLDVEAFDDTLDQAARSQPSSRSDESKLLAAAVELYRGDLMAGFYDDWFWPDQVRLRERLLTALNRLTDLSQSVGDYEDALIHARRLAQLDPMREEAHRRVMRLAVLLDRHNDAIRQYEICVDILRDDLGADPSPTTVALYRQIQDDRQAHGGRSAIATEGSPLFDPAHAIPMVGRDSERATLVRRLDEVLDGQGGIALIEGEAGVGKTRLLAEVADDAQWRGMDVLRGTNSPTTPRPYAALTEALQQGLGTLRARQVADNLDPIWRDQLSGLLPALGGQSAGPSPSGMSRGDEQARMREAFAVAVQATAKAAPTLLLIEDLHWADEDTLAALRMLAPRLQGYRILIAVTYRHTEAREVRDVWETLRAVDRSAATERISLAPCTPAQTEELIRRSLDRAEVSGEFSEWIHRETGGVPLLVLETLRARTEQGQVGDMLHHEDPEPANRLPLTPTVHSLILGRLEGLTNASRAALDIVAVDDAGLMLSEIVSAADDGVDVLAGIDDLSRRQLVVERNSGFSVGHELMRRVVYDAIPQSHLLNLHRVVATAIEQHRPDQIEVLAHHFGMARMPHRAAHYFEAAGARAMAVHAYDTAARHLTLATEALEEIDAPSSRLYQTAAMLEETLDTLADRDQQERALEIMARHADAHHRSEVHRRRAWWLAHVDRFVEAVTEAGIALDLAQQGDDGGAAVGALTTLGMIACWGGQAAEGVEHLERAITLDGADTSQVADARNALGQNLIDLQRFSEAEEHLLAALALYGSLDNARGQAEVLGMLGMLRMERGEPESAAGDFARAIQMSSSIGYRHGEPINQMNLGILRGLRSQLGPAFDAFDAAAEAFRQIGNSRGRALVLANSAWMRHAMLGQDARAEADVGEAMAIYSDIGDVRGQAQALATMGCLAWRKGEQQDGLRLLDEARSIATGAADW